jgi:hypothetical protein
VNVSSRRSWGRFAGLGALSLALLASPALVLPAHALPAPGPDVKCLSPVVAKGPSLHRIPDTSPFTSATRDRVEREVAATTRMLDNRARLSAGANTAATLPVYRVNVQIHIIHGRHAGEHRVKRRGAYRLFHILRDGYYGAQSTASEPMGMNFVLKRITTTRNERWYHAAMNSRADRQMRRKLHRGTAQTLNIYLKKPSFPGGSILLGYSTFPWHYAGHKLQDAVVLNVDSLPGGRATNYNLGDTVIHETGHWLGLLHTFQSATGAGCDPYNDGVSDTPAEKGPNTACADVNNICNPTDLETMADPAYNFMEYTYDACMRMFTPGQHARAAQMFATYRFGR